MVSDCPSSGKQERKPLCLQVQLPELPPPPALLPQPFLWSVSQSGASQGVSPGPDGIQILEVGRGAVASAWHGGIAAPPARLHEERVDGPAPTGDR